MSQLSKYLQYAENLLESADERAAVSLTQSEARKTVDEAEEATVERRITQENRKSEQEDTEVICQEKNCQELHQAQTKTIKKLRKELSIALEKRDFQQEQVQSYQQDAEQLEQEYADRIKAFESQIQKYQDQREEQEAQFQVLEQKYTTQTEELHSVKIQLQQTLANQEVSWTNAALSSNDSQQVIKGLQAELEDSQLALAEMKAKYTDIRQIADNRQKELEETTAELGRKLMDAQGASNSANKMKEEVAGFQAAAGSFAQKSLELELKQERQKNSFLEQDIKALTEELAEVRSSATVQVSATQRELDKAHYQIEQLNIQLQEALKRGNQPAKTQSRVQDITRKLMEKQKVLEHTKTKLSALEARYNLSQQQLQQLQRRSNPGNLESGRSATSDMTRASRIKTERLHLQWFDRIDQFILSAMRFLRLNVLFRLFFVLYICLLQCWAFAVVTMRTNALEDKSGD